MATTAYHDKITHSPNGTPVCTVKHIYFTDEERETLRTHLRPFIEGTKDRSLLRDIIRNPAIFPANVLSEFEALKEEHDLKAVFVLHNAPEIAQKDLPDEQNPRIKSWIAKNTFGACIIEGVFQHLHERADIGAILRPRDGMIVGGKLHRDNRPFAAVTVLKSDGAATRITDYANVLRQLAHRQDLQDFKVIVAGKEFPLVQFDQHFPNWQSARGGITLEIAPHQPAALLESYEELVRHNSANLQLEPGVIAFWGNRGRIFHQALPTQHESMDDAYYSRIALAVSAPRLPNR